MEQADIFDIAMHVIQIHFLTLKMITKQYEQTELKMLRNNYVSKTELFIETTLLLAW